MSVKSFHDLEASTRIRVAEQLFRQWMPICHRAESIGIMLWIGDGSEILDYRGDLESSFEWGRWLGSANHSSSGVGLKSDNKGGDEQGVGFHGNELDPNNIGLHRRSYPYRENAAKFTYGWLRELIKDLKIIGERLTGKSVSVGLTFDPGPEFSISDFKYNRHPELCPGGINKGLMNAFIPCTARLNADSVAYAGFPDGIPEGTTIGTFLGRQTAHLQANIGFDFLWLSNGFGFGEETWSCRGKLFDGNNFYPERAASQRQFILNFWCDLRNECPDLNIRTRGTNLTTGIDLASDGVPLGDIYQDKNVEAPVNSPWAALDGDFGLELTGWMSHIASLPNHDFTYRFYAHDPWWMNSPWLDRFERRAHDIFLPLCISRLNETGSIEVADSFNLLTADNSLGELSDVVAAEVCAQLLRTRELTPDALAPLLWIYPFEEYHQKVFGDTPEMASVYAGDWFIRGLINNGLPLNTVASSCNFLKSFNDDSSRYQGCVLVLPVPAPNSELRAALWQHIEDGGRAIIYGRIADEDTELLNLLGLASAENLSGDLELGLSAETHNFFNGETIPMRIHHPSIYSDGALCHHFIGNNTTSQLAWAKQAQEERALAIVTRVNEAGGAIGWLRGGVSCDENKRGGLLPAPLDKSQFFATESLGRAVLEHLGHFTKVFKKETDRTPMCTIARCRNGWVFATYNPDATEIEISFTHGAPAPLGIRVDIANNKSRFIPDIATLNECRVFVQQVGESTVYVRELPSIMAGIRRRWQVNGLNNSTVRFFPESNCENSVEFLANPVFPYLIGEFLPFRAVASPDGFYFEVKDVTGTLLISW
jgi:hypothetical protein